MRKLRSHPSKLASQRAGTGQQSTRGHCRNKDIRALRNAREALRGFGRCGTQAEREGRGKSLQAKRSCSEPARATMRVHKKAVQMTLLVYLLATTVCVQGSEDTRLQSRIVRFLQESFPSGQGPFGSNQGAFSGGQSPPPGNSQNFTPIPRDSSLAKAVLTGQGPGRKLLSFEAMRPLYSSSLDLAGGEVMPLRQRTYREQSRSRGLLERLMGTATSELRGGVESQQASVLSYLQQ